MSLNELVDNLVSRQKKSFADNLLLEVEAHYYFDEGRVLLTLDSPMFILMNKNCLCLLSRQFDHWQARYFIVSKVDFKKLGYIPRCIHASTHPFGQLKIIDDLAKISQHPTFDPLAEFDIDSIERYLATFLLMKD
jgi:hypothetical protein